MYIIKRAYFSSIKLNLAALNVCFSPLLPETHHSWGFMWNITFPTWEEKLMPKEDTTTKGGKYFDSNSKFLLSFTKQGMSWVDIYFQLFFADVDSWGYILGFWVFKTDNEIFGGGFKAPIHPPPLEQPKLCLIPMKCIWPTEVLLRDQKLIVTGILENGMRHYSNVRQGCKLRRASLV